MVLLSKQIEKEHCIHPYARKPHNRRQQTGQREKCACDNLRCNAQNQYPMLKKEKAQYMISYRNKILSTLKISLPDGIEKRKAMQCSR